MYGFNLFLFSGVLTKADIFYLYTMTRNTTPVRRRRFFRLLGGILSVPFLFLVGLAVKKSGQDNGPGRLVLPEVPEGVTFHGGVITVREGGHLRVLSSQCTHLGCRIRTLRDGRLQCPCHGSEFATDGTVLKGPAGKPLPQLSHKTDPATGRLIIYLNRQV